MDLLKQVEKDVNAFLSLITDGKEENKLAAGIKTTSTICGEKITEWECLQGRGNGLGLWPSPVKIASDKKFKSKGVDLCISVKDFQHWKGCLEVLELHPTREFSNGSHSLIKEIEINDQKTEYVVKLNKEKSFKNFIQCVCTLRETYGHVRHKKNGLIFVNPVPKNGKKFTNCDQQKAKETKTEEVSLDDMRSFVTAIHLRNVYEANGYCCRIFHRNDKASFDTLLSEERVSPTKQPDSQCGKIFVNQFVAKCKETSYRKRKDIEDMSNEYSKEDVSIEIDLGRYVTDLSEQNGGKEKFHKNMKCVKVLDTDDKLMPCLADACGIEINLSDAFKSLEKQRFSVLHVVPMSFNWDVQVSSLLWRLLSDHSESINKMMLCCCGPCSAKNEYTQSNSQSFEKYLSSKCDEIREAYASRYGAKVQGEEWEETIRNVALACIKFDILSFPIRNKIEFKVNPSVDDSNASRGSLFVLYNYSRLCNLLRNYEKEVKNGNYESLPEVQDVDFSNLKEEAEWRLFVKYVLQYPLLVRSIGQALSEQGDKLNFNPNVNKICTFLMSLARDLSSYYHQTKILLDPRPHLFPVTFARMYLIIAIKQVMLNAFGLIGVIPPKQM